MTDRECVQLLQWALPKLRLRWPGFRKVRGQVCKRLTGRARALGLAGDSDYEVYLERHPDEWEVLDRCCRITISRFYRDRGAFSSLEQVVLPRLARYALSRGYTAVSCWCAGCASGEEPYSLAILWKLRLQDRFPALRLNILATDVDETLLERGRQARYRASSFKELPAPFLTEAFVAVAGEFILREPYRDVVRFLCHDLRKGAPDGSFDLVFCRNLAFTYFEDSLQREVLAGIRGAMAPCGALVIGSHESLPAGSKEFVPWEDAAGVYRIDRSEMRGNPDRPERSPDVIDPLTVSAGTGPASGGPLLGSARDR
jgi:chemotaxis protein methyltransferase CheR